MKYGSVCSGIEAASVAWEPLGFQAQFFSEIEPFPCAVLNHHWPHIPNHGDMTKFKEWPNETIDILVGGTPCQSFSIAGLRKGLADPRGNLMLTYLAIAARYSPEWLVWENVPGVLSSNQGRDFAAFLNGLAELGYGFAYRILDAKHFGVPQRRRRVFLVANSRSWQRAAAVLFERASLSGHIAPSGNTQKNASAFIESSFGGYVESPDAGTITASGGALSGGSESLVIASGKNESGNTNVLCVNGNIINRTDNSGGDGMGVIADGTSYTLTATNRHAVLHETCAAGEARDSREGTTEQERSGKGWVGETPFAIRRLTVEECEFLQGFPRGHTQIPWRGKPAEACPDGPRYKAIGNSMAVPVMRWIGERIQQVSEID